MAIGNIGKTVAKATATHAASGPPSGAADGDAIDIHSR